MDEEKNNEVEKIIKGIELINDVLSNEEFLESLSTEQLKEYAELIVELNAKLDSLKE